MPPHAVMSQIWSFGRICHDVRKISPSKIQLKDLKDKKLNGF